MIEKDTKIFGLFTLLFGASSFYFIKYRYKIARKVKKELEEKGVHPGPEKNLAIVYLIGGILSGILFLLCLFISVVFLIKNLTT